MRPRVAYWVSSFEPEIEAVASEVRVLRDAFPGSIAWGLSPRHYAIVSPRRGFGLHPKMHLLFRAATRLFEPAFQLNHIFGSLGDWFYLQGARRRPTILTVAHTAAPVEPALLDRIDRFIVEDTANLERLQSQGIDRDRIERIFPPVDLERFRPAPAPEGPFTVLFASSPDRADWLEARGVLLLLEVAALRPAMRFRLLWRPWGDSLERIVSILGERNLPNVELSPGREERMERAYRASHVTIAPFLNPAFCKASPNSLIESLACGRPVVTTPAVGIAALLDEAGAGLLAQPTAAALAEALDRIEREWPDRSRRSHEFAAENFRTEHFIARHARLYESILRPRSHHILRVQKGLSKEFPIREGLPVPKRRSSELF